MSEQKRTREETNQMRKARTLSRKASRREDAEKRQAKRDKLSPAEQLRKLDVGGYKAQRERDRLIVK